MLLQDNLWYKNLISNAAEKIAYLTKIIIHT